MGKFTEKLPVSIKAIFGLALIIFVVTIVLSQATCAPTPNRATSTVTATVVTVSTPTVAPAITSTSSRSGTTPNISPSLTVTIRAASNISETVGLPASTPPDSVSKTPVFTYEIVNTYPHDPNAFTQGLIFVDGTLYEGTGRYGQSSLRKVDLETGEVLQIRRLPVQFFGEGITLFDNKIIQLTWKSGRGFIYDPVSFELLREFTYPTEGWGITHNGEQLIMSDGTSTLYFWDPNTLAEVDQVQVFDEQGPVVRLNELEYINGEVYANVWQTDRIAKIDPQTGQVTGWILLSGLLSQEDKAQPVDVLNGIAYDPVQDRLFVTGKLWPKLFEIKLNLLADK